MITEKKFCKACGQQLREGAFDHVLGRKYLELADGYYCIECGTIAIKKKREALKNG